MDKPVILIGNGCRNNPELVEYLCTTGAPVMTTWPAADLVPEDCPAFVGRPGIFGMRAANIIQQKASILYCFGARLDGEQVAYNYDNFAPGAHKIIYDIDSAELDKLPSTLDWQKEVVDLGTPGPGVDTPEYIDYSWLAWCRALYDRFRPELDGINSDTKPGYIHPFQFFAALSDACQPTDVLAMGSSGGAPVAFFQTFKIKHGQRVTNLSTIGAMGADIPMAIGAAIASGRRTICATGDGGIMLNTQELETARRLHLPITYFVFNNGGYGSIRTMQDARFGGRRLGCDLKSGLTLPPLEGIAEAYRLHYRKLTDLADLPGMLTDGAVPFIAEVPIDPEWKHLPRVMARMEGGRYYPDPMERMTPYLPDDELQALMDWDGEA